MKSGFVVSLAAFAICATALLPAAARAACPPEPGTLPHDKTTRPDSAAFPADPSNCNFHQWSWHMFLWLTQIDPKTKEPRFLSFAGPDSLHPGIAGPKSTEPLMPGLQLTNSKSLKDYLQAGPDGILVDQQGRIVYYSIYLDDVFKKFTVDNSLNTVAGLRAFDPNKAFPVDTLSLKAAWKIVKPGENMSGYYTRKAKINLLKQEGTKIVVDLDKKPVEATVALAGFHIAGTVAHHKEMIWASFENVNNAPDLPQSLNTMRPTVPVSNKSWTFYKKGTQFKDCNVNPANSGTQKLNEKTQVMTPVTQVCRLYPYGSGPDKQGNADNIKLINADVQKQLKDVWRNYFEVGAIWFDTGGDNKELQPNCTFQPGSLQCGVVVTGSTHLSNAIIETFTQSQSVFDNCFACHNTVQRFGPTANVDPLPGKNVNISHILNNLYFFLEEKASPEK